MNSYFQKMPLLIVGILSSGHLSYCPGTEFLHSKGFSLMVLISSMIISVFSDSLSSTFFKKLFFNDMCMCGFVPADAGICKVQKVVPGSPEGISGHPICWDPNFAHSNSLAFATLNLFCFRTKPARITFSISFCSFSCSVSQ